jgi:hypothetical protein
MKHLKTMAMIIDANTYPIAVACLPGPFATLPFGEVDGHVLVINEFVVAHRPYGVRYTSLPGRQRDVTLSNSWMSIDVFEKEYVYVNIGRRSSFFNEIAKRGVIDKKDRDSALFGTNYVGPRSHAFPSEEFEED